MQVACKWCKFPILLFPATRLVVARYFQPDMVGFKFPCTPVMHCSIGDLLMFYCNRSQRTRGVKRSLSIRSVKQEKLACKNLSPWIKALKHNILTFYFDISTGFVDGREISNKKMNETSSFSTRSFPLIHFNFCFKNYELMKGKVDQGSKFDQYTIFFL